MPNNRISKAKQVFILSALSEGTPINAVCRILGVGKQAVKRVIEETGEALASYMQANFRDLPCTRIEMDEQWQYVGKHGQRMAKEEAERGDFWLWAAIDPDTKLIVSYRVGRRDSGTAEAFVADASKRISGPVQVTTDGFRNYKAPMYAYFNQPGSSYATEAKEFVDGFVPENWPKRRKNGIPKIAKATREEVWGQPDLGSATTAHIERLFLSVRQELTRFTRCTLGYSKDLRMHKLAVHVHLGIYNLCRKHSGIDGQTPAQAAGVELKRWTVEDVITMTEAYWAPKIEAEKQAAALARRLKEDAMFANA